MKQKTGRKLIGFLLSLALVLGLMPGMSMTAYADGTESITYMGWDETEKKLKEMQVPQGTTVTKITADTTGIGTENQETWYIAEGKTIITSVNGITVKGTVNLILADDAVMNISASNTAGIGLVQGATLNVYGQTGGSGVLNVVCTSDFAGIMYWSDDGTDTPLNVYGGTINATGKRQGINVGYSRTVSIYGGVLKAKTTGDSSGLHENVRFYGGELYSYGGDPKWGKAVNGTITAGEGMSMSVFRGEKDDDDYKWTKTVLDNQNKTDAQYVKVTKKVFDEYTVTLYTNEGTINSGAVTKYIEESGAVLPNDVTREGYTFAGWYDNAEFSGSPVTEIAATETDDKEYWAKWLKNLSDNFIQPVADQTYTGSAITPSITVKDGDTALNKDTDYTVAYSGNVNAGTATVTVTAKEGSDYSGTATAKFTINKAALTVTAPTAKTLTYTGSAQELVTAGTTDGGEMQYALGTDATNAPTDGWGASIPSKTDAGIYYVWYKVVGDGNHNNVDPTKVEVTISQKAATITAVDASKTYGAADPTLTATVEGTVGEDTLNYTLTRAEGENVGDYDISVTLGGNPNYDVTATNGKLTIDKANSSATAPTALNLTYTGSAQALVEAGSATGGTMQYSLDGQTYSAEIPTGTDAGDYTVYYKVVGDSNHKDTDAAKIIITISAADTSPAAPGTATYTVTPDSALTYNGEAQALVTGGSVEGGELQYALGSDAETVPEDAAFSAEIPTGTNAGTYFVWYRVVGDANHNDVAPACLPVTIDKAAIAPTVTITGWTYGEAANAPSVEGNSGNGEVRCEYSDAKDGTYTDVVPSEPGTYFVRAIIAETENYLGATTEPLSFAIARASEPTPVEPDAPETPDVPTTPVAAAKDILIATMVSESDTALKLTWPSQDGVDGYDVFFRKCSSGKDFPLLASLDGANATSYTVTGLLKETSYKAYVKAWVKGNGGKKYVATSPEVHAFTANGTKSISNPGTLTAPDSVTVKLTKTAQIKAKVKGIKKGKLANHVKNLRYISDNTAVVTVTTSGKIKAVGAGSCKIYVLTTNGIWKTVTVNVDASPTKIKINGAKRTMEIGATQALGGKVKLTPTAAITTVSWSSSDPAVATVDANGVVTALSKGKAVITATTANGKKAKVTIKVK